MKQETVSVKEMFYSTGRRKSAIAKVWLVRGGGKVRVNGKPVETYFPMESQAILIQRMFDLTDVLKEFDDSTTALGGGKSGQADALRLGIARALVRVDSGLKKMLKENGLLTRDSRIKERKKYGRKRARKSFQFSKR